MSILIRSMQLLNHLWNRSLKVRKIIIQRTEPLSIYFFVKLLQGTRRVEFWHLLQNRFSKARKTCPNIPRTSWTFCSFGHLQCRFHNLPETSIQTPIFFVGKITQECGIEHVIYSFNDSVEKLFRRIEKLSGWNPTSFSGKDLPFI